MCQQQFEAEVLSEQQEYECRIKALGWKSDEVEVPTLKDIQSDPLFQMMCDLMRRPLS